MTKRLASFFLDVTFNSFIWWEPFIRWSDSAHGPYPIWLSWLRIRSPGQCGWRTEWLAYANHMSHGCGLAFHLALVMDRLSLQIQKNWRPLFNVHLSSEAECASPAHAENCWLAMPANWLPDWETIFSFTASFTCKCQRTRRSNTPDAPFMKRTIL